MYPDLLVLVFSIRDESFYVERALRAGAKGYLMKGEATEKIIEAIRQIIKGDIYVSDKIKSVILEKYITGHNSGTSAIDQLSDREIAVFQLIGRGFSTREIAESLKISVKTVVKLRSFRVEAKRGLPSLAGGALEYVAPFDFFKNFRLAAAGEFSYIPISFGDAEYKIIYWGIFPKLYPFSKAGKGLNLSLGFSRLSLEMTTSFTDPTLGTADATFKVGAIIFQSGSAIALSGVSLPCSWRLAMLLAAWMIQLK